MSQSLWTHECALFIIIGLHPGITFSGCHSRPANALIENLVFKTGFPTAVAEGLKPSAAEKTKVGLPT